MNSERDLFKLKPRRILNLKDSAWKVIRSFASSTSFELHHPRTGCIVVYRCPNSYLAAEWTSKLTKATGEESLDDFVRL